MVHNRPARLGRQTVFAVVGALCIAGVVSLLLPGGWWSTAAGPEEVLVEVRTVAFDRNSNAPVIVLQSEARQRALPIWIGTYEAQAIAMEIEGVAGPRPLTHDLMKAIVEQLHAELDRIVIDELRGHTYYATIHLKAGGASVEVDSRPSDAIALALRFDRPIFVQGDLLAGDAGVSLLPQEPAVDVVRLWGLTIQDVDARLAEVFAVGAERGVLVSDVGPGAAAGVVRRGDVITEFNGSRVSTIADLISSVERIEDDPAVHLALGREGARLQVHFQADAR